MINFYEKADLTQDNLINTLDFLNGDREHCPDTEKYASWCYILAKRFNTTVYLFSSNSGELLIKLNNYRIFPREKVAELLTRDYKVQVWGGDNEIPKIKDKNGVIIKFERV